MDVIGELTCSQKKYLLAIYQLSLQQGSAKSTDVARAVGVSKSSTACMTARLCENGYVCKAYYGQIQLTKNGLLAAKAIFDQVCLIRDFLVNQLLVAPEQAQADAVAITVYTSPQTLAQLTGFLTGTKGT